jgi:hypothetical protein
MHLASRRSRVSSAVVGCGTTFATVLCGCTDPDAEASSRPAHEAPLSAFVDGEWSSVTRTPFTGELQGDRHILMSLEFSFPEDRVLSSPSLKVGGDTADHGYLWPHDGQDHEGEQLDDPLPLQAGTEVMYEALLTPDCDEPDLEAPISLTVSTKLSGGESVVEQFVPKNAEVFADALTLACGTGLAMQAGGGSLLDHGEARVAFTVSNPGTSPVSVKVPPLTQNGASWRAANFTVPAGSFTVILLAGQGVVCGNHEGVPWTAGRVLVDNQHADPPLIQSWDC